MTCGASWSLARSPQAHTIPTSVPRRHMKGQRCAACAAHRFCFSCCWPFSAGRHVHRAAAPAGDLVKADLLAEPAAIAPGQTFWVAVRLRMKEHWHTYWRNPGDSGEATAITWQLPPGFTAGPIQWPTPHRIPVGPLANYGYDGETTLLTQITAPAGLAPSTQVPINADVTWLVCEKECIPGEAHLSLTLPAVAAGRTSPAGSAETRALFEAARATLPQPSPWTAQHGGGAGHADLACGGLQPEATGGPLGTILPVLRDADPARRAADAGGERCRPQPGAGAQRAHHRHAEGRAAACSSSRRISAPTPSGTRSSWTTSRSPPPRRQGRSAPSCRPPCSLCWAGSFSILCRACSRCCPSRC